MRIEDYLGQMLLSLNENSSLIESCKRISHECKELEVALKRLVAIKITLN